MPHASIPPLTEIAFKLSWVRRRRFLGVSLGRFAVGQPTLDGGAFVAKMRSDLLYWGISSKQEIASFASFDIDAFSTSCTVSLWMPMKPRYNVVTASRFRDVGYFVTLKVERDCSVVPLGPQCPIVDANDTDVMAWRFTIDYAPHPAQNGIITDLQPQPCKQTLTEQFAKGSSILNTISS